MFGRNVWLSWVAVCAAEPVLLAVAATAFFKKVLDTDPLAEPISFALLIVIAAALLAPVVLQWLVLRCLAPRLRFWTWFVCVLFALAVAALLEVKAGQWTRLVDRDFEIAANLMRRERTPFGFLALPWGPLLSSTVAVTAAKLLVPAWVFARAAGLRWYVPLLAAVAGACAAVFADQAYEFYDLYIHNSSTESRYEMNGRSWYRRVAQVCLLGGTGGLWGAGSALVLALLSRRSEDSQLRRRLCDVQGARGLGIMLAGAVAIAIAAPTCAIAFTPFKARAAYNSLRKALSVAPSSDVATGDEVLRYSHAADVRSAYPLASFSPDGASFVALTVDRKLVRIETATGKAVGSIGEQLGRSEGFRLAWSPDGRYLALATDGEEVAFADTRYRRARFGVYSLPDHAAVGDYSHRDHECSRSYADPSMMFDADSNSLWVACAQDTYPKPQDLMAIKLAIPSMTVLELRFFGDGATSEAVRGLVRIGAGVWAWQHASAYADEFRVRDLTNDRDVTELRDLDQPRFAENFLAQRAQVTESRITLDYEGASPAGAPTMRRLVFDARSGELVEKTDEPGSMRVLGRAVMETDSLRIEATWRADSKAGEINVFDPVSRERRQRIFTRAQRPVAFSPDGRWLVMNAFEDEAIRLYRVTP